MNTNTTIFAATTQKKTLVLSFLLVGIFVVSDFVGASVYLRRLVEQVIRPYQLVSAHVTASSFSPLSSLQSLRTAQRRIQDLELRYAAASAQLGEIDRLKAENQALREMLNASDIKLAQRTLSFPIVSYGRPLIAGGRNEGIKEGQMVLIQQTLIGLIGSVSETQAEVQLLTQEGGTPILAHTESGHQGLVVGDGKRVILTEIPPEAQVKEGDRVVTDGQAGIARDVFIGRVARIHATPADSTQTIVLDQLVSFYESEVLEIR